MENKFEKFTNTVNRNYKPIAAIWSRGKIGFNTESTILYNIKEYKYSLIFFNKNTNQIGIKFTNEVELGVKKITKTKYDGAYLNAMSFFKKYNINYQQNQHYEIEYNNDTDMLIIDLNKNLK